MTRIRYLAPLAAIPIAIVVSAGTANAHDLKPSTQIADCVNGNADVLSTFDSFNVPQGQSIKSFTFLVGSPFQYASNGYQITAHTFVKPGTSSSLTVKAFFTDGQSATATATAVIPIGACGPMGTTTTTEVPPSTSPPTSSAPPTGPTTPTTTPSSAPSTSQPTKSSPPANSTAPPSPSSTSSTGGSGHATSVAHPTTELPVTGFPTDFVVGLGLGLVFCGAAGIYMTRKRGGE